jgi:hypothetical protein
MTKLIRTIKWRLYQIRYRRWDLSRRDWSWTVNARAPRGWVEW